MKAFSQKRCMKLLNKLAYYKSINEIGGYLTPAEIMHCMQMGMRIWSETEEDALHRIEAGECQPRWVYFQVGALDPQIMKQLVVGRKMH